MYLNVPLKGLFSSGQWIIYYNFPLNLLIYIWSIKANYYYLLYYYIDFFSFSINIFSVPESNPGYHNAFGHHIPLVPSSQLQFLSVSWFFITLKFLKSTSQVFCRMFLNLGLSDVFLKLRLGLWVLGMNKYHRGEGDTCY